MLASRKLWLGLVEEEPCVVLLLRRANAAQIDFQLKRLLGKRVASDQTHCFVLEHVGNRPQNTEFTISTVAWWP
jgi:hypothetical protein